MDKDATLNRDLSLFLQDQLEMLLVLQRQVLAIEHVFERVPELQALYMEHLAKVKEKQSIPTNPQWLAHTQSILERLQKET